MLERLGRIEGWSPYLLGMRRETREKAGTMNPHLFRSSGGTPAPYWLKFWVLLLLVPACFALVSMSPTWAVVTVVLTFGLPLATWLGLHVHHARELPTHASDALRFAAGVSVTVLGLGGLFAFSAALGWAALAVYAATGLLMLVRGRNPSAAAPATAEPDDTMRQVTDDEDAPADPATTPDVVRQMTDAELCHAWRSSFVALQRARGLHLRATLVQTRQLLLDEIDTRHPAGLQAWLASGARAASGPERFIHPKGETGHPEAA
jgi:hypothetical protein